MSDKFEAIFPPNIDSTIMSAFRSCHRKSFNEFILGLRPPGISIDLHAGGCFAKAVETIRRAVHIKGYDLPNALMAGQVAFEAEWGDVEPPPTKKTAKTKDRVWEAVDDYFKKYPPITDHIQPFVANGKPTLEFTFAIPLEPAVSSWVKDEQRLTHFPLHPVTGEPIFYSGRLDMLGHQVNSGLIVGVDDKTGSTGFYAGWSEKWDLRSQFIGYTWALQQYGINCEHIAVRGIGILQTIFHHAEIIKPYSNHLRAIWLEQLRRDLWKMVDCWHEGYWDYNLGESCTAYGNCIFGQACQSPNADAWLSNLVVRRWNPLAADPTES
jgi:hypothetical protein